jgi:hypothetical protein
MSMRKRRDTLRHSESTTGFEDERAEAIAQSEQEIRRKAATRTRKPRLIRSTPKQWAASIATETCLDKHVVQIVLAELLDELTRRIMLGEAVLLPVGCLEPGRSGRVFRNLNGELEEDPVALKLRTTYAFRKKYQKAMAKFDL